MNIKYLIPMLFLSGCGFNQKPADIFDYTLNDGDVHANHCPDCSWYNLPGRIYSSISQPLTFQINPHKFNNGLKGTDSYYLFALNLDAPTAVVGTPTAGTCIPGLPPDPKKPNDKGTQPKFTKAERARNALLGFSFSLADKAIANHMGDIKATEIDANVLLGVATSGFSAGATLVSPAAAKTYSAVASSTNATRSLFNESVYRNALSESLIGAVDAELISQKQDILEKLLYNCSDQYPVDIALSDVQRYNNAGSFYNGLALLRTAAEQNSSKKVADVNKTTGSGNNATIPGVQATGDVANTNGSNNTPNNVPPKLGLTQTSKNIALLNSGSGFFDVVISDVPQGDHVNLSVTGNGVIIKNATYKNIKSDTKSTDFKFDSNAGTVTVLADMTVAYEVTGLNKGDTITVTATMYLDDKTIDTKTLNFTAN